MSAMCLDIGNMMPRHSDRTRMTDMAQKWLELAWKGEAEETADATKSPVSKVVTAE
jgi:hypothetical protein